jgi:uncharacterized RDD family membrane protein YckC
MTAEYSHVRNYRDVGMPDPATHPELFDGVLGRRAFAYMVDVCVIAAIMIAAWIIFALLTVVSFGLLGPGLWFLFGLIPLAYHTLLVGGRHGATVGMRLLDLELRSWDGERPAFLQALAHAALFYLTVGATGCLILLFALINKRSRTLHDVLSGTLMVRSTGLVLMRA